MLLVVKSVSFAIIVLIIKKGTEMSTEKTRYRMFTFMQYLKHPDTGEGLYSEDKSH